MRDYLIHLLGGTPNSKVLNERVADLYNTISEEDILKTKGEWSINGKPLSENEVRLLQSEAKTFLNTRLWKVLQNDVKYKANKAMFDKAVTEMDLTAGKLWLYTLDCISTTLKNLTE